MWRRIHSSGRDVGIVRWLHRQDGEERLSIAFALFIATRLQIVNKEIGERVCFIAGQTVLKRVVALAAVNPAVPLAVVVFVADPMIKIAAPFGWNDV